MTLSGKCLYTGHTRSWLFVSQLLVSISIHCSFVPEYTRLFLQWFHSSAFHWPYYSPHSNNCWSVQHKATTMHATLLQSRLTLYDPMDDSLPGSSVHGDSPGKNTGVGCHSLLQGIFPTQGLNPGLSIVRGLHIKSILKLRSREGRADSCLI